MSEDNFLEIYQETKEKMTAAIESFDSLIAETQRRKKALEEQVQTIIEEAQITKLKIDPEMVKQLIRKPYVIVDIGKKDIWKVVVWRGVEFSVGWLEHQDDSFDIYVVNKYAHYLGEIPTELEERFQFKEPLPLKVFDGMLLTGEDFQANAWERYKKFLVRREGSDRIRIKKGSEFDLIAEMIDDGILPFRPQPVDENDLRTYSGKLQLRDYQLEAYTDFLTKGAMGIYWSMGSGKTYLALYAMAHLKGRKLIVVPSLTLVQQWEERIKDFIPGEISKVDIIHYLSGHKVMNNSYTLTVFDECHHLPANTFSKLATINTKYRMGLSATPYREDGRSNYIFALTGFPRGLRWEILFKLGVIKKPDIIVYIVRTLNDKYNKLEELLQEKVKTIIFCDSIELGKKLEKRFEYPFIYGSTSAQDRLEIVRNSKIVFVSRIGDEGLSVEDVEMTIEFDYFGKSKRQALQRSGRVIHSNIFLKSKKNAKHIILMTDQEFQEDWEERSLPYREKRFKIDVIRG